MSDSVNNTIDLQGDWAFCYQPIDHHEIGEKQMTESRPSEPHPPAMPADEAFDATMPAPGNWDEHWDRLRESESWSKARFTRHRPVSFPAGPNPPNGSLPHLQGIGWYRRTIHPKQLPEAEHMLAWLHLGAVRLKAWVWINGRFAGYHDDHATEVHIALHPHLRPDADNRITVAVSNISDLNGVGCEIRGWKGQAAGVRPPVELIVADGAAIEDLFGCWDAQAGMIRWEVTCSATVDQPLELDWKLIDPANGRTVQQRKVKCAAGTTNWSTSAEELEPWSDERPKMYRAEATLNRSGRPVHRHSQPFGLRRLHAEGTQLRLNDRPVYLRGGTEHAYFPETCIPPFDKQYYVKRLRRLKAIGFNWLRFHTWTPPEPYLAAADEVGMLMQVEMPRGYTVNTRWGDVEDPEVIEKLTRRGRAVWDRILSRCRRHPSVVLYCGGNEEWLSEVKIEQLADLAELQHRRAPGALFSPQEAISGVMHHGPGVPSERMDAIADQLIHEPVPYHPKRLERLRQFSDVLEPGTFMQLHYLTLKADPAEIDRRLAVLEKPLLGHELGITAGFLDLSLADRYKGTMIGTELFDAAREHMRDVGLLHRAPIYARHAAAHQRMLRKHNLENARRCKTLTGYDYLGPIDQHWHRWGYDCGILNEFYELKPGESQRDVLRYNGASVLLCDHGDRRVFGHGDKVSLPIQLSHYAPTPIDRATLHWHLRRDDGRIVDQGQFELGPLVPGCVEPIADIALRFPGQGPPCRLTLHVRLEGAPVHLDNEWHFWSFPASSVTEDDSVTTRITPDDVHAMQRGKRLLLLGAGGLPTLNTNFQSAFPGRPQGNVATVIAEHPCWGEFPRSEWCEWQFRSMIDNGRAVVFDDLHSPFTPILEMVSSYKMMHKQAALFEYRIGQGGLLVCTLDLDTADPAAAYLRQTLCRYLHSRAFVGEHAMHPRDIARLCEATGEQMKLDITDTDMGFDPLEQ